MKTTSISKPVLIAGLALAFLAWPAVQTQAQTLQERIEAVRQRRAAQEAAKRKLAPEAKILQALLYRKLAVDFDKVPAADVFQYLRTVLEIDITVRSMDDTAGHGLDPKTPITIASEKVTALALLEAVLEECSQLEPCTWQLRNGVLEVGTKERLSVDNAQIVRIYPIDDVVHRPAKVVGPPYEVGIINPWGGAGGYGGYGASIGFQSRGWYGGFGGGTGTGYGNGARPGTDRQTADERSDRVQQIIDLIMDTVEPDAWVENGGDWATINYQEGALIVRAPDFVHRQINGYPPVPPPSRKSPTSRATNANR